MAVRVSCPIFSAISWPLDWPSLLLGLLVVSAHYSLPWPAILSAVPALSQHLQLLLYETGGVLGVTQAVVLSTGFSSFHLADIDSGRNVFIVGFSIFMALLLPRWFREAPVLLSTGGKKGDGKRSCFAVGKQGLKA